MNVERMRRQVGRSGFNKDSWRTLDPADKIALIEAMGFTPTWDPHQPDCPATWGSGYICNCVSDPTFWTAPTDVVEFRHETWSERLAAKKERVAAARPREAQ